MPQSLPITSTRNCPTLFYYGVFSNEAGRAKIQTMFKETFTNHKLSSSCMILIWTSPLNFLNVSVWFYVCALFPKGKVANNPMFVVAVLAWPSFLYAHCVLLI